MPVIRYRQPKRFPGFVPKFALPLLFTTSFVPVTYAIGVDGVVSYSMPQGGDRSYSTSSVPLSNPIGSFSANFRDLSYDGQQVGTDGHLTDGMGQLMDNVAYLGNVTTALTMYPSQPGFHFVGWHQPGQTDVPIVFKFDTGRSVCCKCRKAQRRWRIYLQ